MKFHEKSPESHVTPGFEKCLGDFTPRMFVPGHKRRGYTDSVFAGCSANCHNPVPDGLRLDRKNIMEGNLAVFDFSDAC